MATWPNESTLFNAAIKGVDASPLMKAWLETNKQLVGAVAPVTLRINNGSITPTAANILVDTEGGAASDTLSVIATSKMQDGAIISLRSADASRKVTVQHSTGTGGLATYDGKNVELDPQWGILACNVAGKWQEIPGGRRAWDRAVAVSPYELGEFYYFRHPTLKPGFQPAQGGLLANAATLYPEAWAYLQTTEGQKLCTTEAEWQAMTKATWATLADGTKVGWDGIGGAPWYVQDLNAGTLRLPDLRGMYAEAAGFDGPLGVGGTHGDGVRNITGRFGANRVGIYEESNNQCTGPFTRHLNNLTNGQYGADIDTNSIANYFLFDVSRVVPTGNAVKPRAWGALACCYLGAPR